MNVRENYQTITREQFLFSEMRIVAKLLDKGMTDKEIQDEIKQNNLFQFPTERMISNIVSVCLRRLHYLDDPTLIQIIAYDPFDTAKQACLYVMMTYYRLVWDFMVNMIGEKYRIKDFSFSKKDVNVFFTQLQEQNETVASWSEETIKKCKSVLIRILVENEYLDSNSSQTLNPVILGLQLKGVIEDTNRAALVAFNYFE